MGPEAQGEAWDAARCSKDVEGPHSSSTSPPVAGVEGQVPGDLEPFSNILGRGVKGPASGRSGPTSAPSLSTKTPSLATSSSPGTLPGASVSGPVEGHPKRNNVKPDGGFAFQNPVQKDQEVVCLPPAVFLIRRFFTAYCFLSPR